MHDFHGLQIFIYIPALSDVSSIQDKTIIHTH